MYEDLNQIAQLKFNKEVESISSQTRDKVKDAQNEYAALTGSAGLRSGQHEASICRLQIDGAEQLVRALYRVWLDLIREPRGYIARPDIGIVSSKIESYARTQKGHLHQAFSQQRRGAVVNLMTQEAGIRMDAVTADLRRDLEIMVREHEAFPSRVLIEKERRMNRMPKKRFSPDRRVLVGNQSRPGTIVSVDDQPSDMGEFRHIVKRDRDGQTLAVLGCDLQAFPELDEDLRQKQLPSIHLHIENSSIANLNLGTQVGTINAALEVISGQPGPSQEVAEALKQLTEATVAEQALPDLEKQEIVQALSTLAEQAAKKPEERSKGPLRAIVGWLPTAIAAAADLTTLWGKFGPAIKVFFGF